MAPSNLTPPTIIVSKCDRHGVYDAKQFTIGDRNIASRCPACQVDEEQKEADRQRAIEVEKHRRRIETMLQRAMIPTRFKDRTLENFTIENDGQAKAHKIAAWYADTWEERLKAGTCLIFSGNAGTGKTHLSTAIANAILARGYSALFSTVADAMRSIKASYDRDANLSEADAINALVSPNLLILDEVQMQQGSDHEKRLMFEVINKRYENIRPTILLSNLGPEALKEFLGDRIMDRLREGGGKFVSFTWGSKRA